MPNANAWTWTEISVILSLIIAALSLLRAYRADNRSELNTILTGHTAQLAEMSREQSRMRQELIDHKENDRKMHEAIERMFASIQAELKLIPHTPVHEEDIPATRREMRHMRDNLNGVTTLMMERFNEFQESLRKDMAAMFGPIASRVEQIDARVRELERRKA